MRSEEEIIQKIKEEKADLVETRKKWNAAIDNPPSRHHALDEEPEYQSSGILFHESVIYALEWVLGLEEEEE